MTKLNTFDWLNELKKCFPTPHNRPCDASVLIVLRESNGCLQVLLTQRSDNLRHHASEWALPGGKTDKGETSLQTALREANEEVGLDSTFVENIGQLDNFKSKNELDVGVCISVLTTKSYQATLNEDEVQKIVWFDLSHICKNPDRTHRFERFGQTIVVPFYDVLKPSLWGLTAMILQSLTKHINYQIKTKPSLQRLLSNK
ncbi:MAG: CoA pyrophosphatase [Saccharospirillaceae bacterium]|nr:CoA pyrophosphatase [Pseudomonadales bacterium]NRB79333.1 CoA pyrophosphatase [Saccharospirillaceae bacterium]